jgi:predicted TIM-barrel fold metal-dependent hydrolase
MSNYKIISSDNHIYEPPDLWTSRVDVSFRDRAPRVVRLEDEGDWWFCDGHKIMGAFAGAQAGRRFEAPEKLSRKDLFENVRPGGYLPEAHVKDMQADGVDAAVIYPTAGLLMFGVPDSELLSAIFRGYNDWLAEFCKPFPHQLKGIAMLNIDDVQAGVNELERCARLGLAGAMITCYPPEGRPYESPEYEPLWEAAQDLGMPLGLHIGTNRPGPGQEFAAGIGELTAAFVCNADHWVRMSLAQMIYSGVFGRYPRLQVGSVEMELSWAPHFLERLDYNFKQRARDLFKKGYWDRYTGDMLPSDYFHRNVFLGFQEDALGIKERQIIGVDNLQWGSDYPHPESTFPRTRQILDEILAECSETEKAKIAGGNAARIYHLN